MLLHMPAYAAGNTHAIQTYLQQGKPEQAISTAYMLLHEGNLDDNERKALLELIAQAQMIIVRAKHYENVEPAIQAIQTLIQEFPNQVNEPKRISQIIELYWKQNNLEQAQAYILDLQSRFPQSPEAQQGWLTLGKIYFIHKNYADARNSFLRFSLAYDTHTRQAREVRMWTALVDYEEGRFDIALQALEQVFKEDPSLITSQDNIYSRYIQLLRIKQRYPQALKQAELFLAQYKTSTHTAEIRLLHADIQRLLPQPNHEEIIKSYTILAETHADTIVGKQAFMRKMMLQLANKKQYAELKPGIIALKRIASSNQMSEVEDEALLLEARLWHRAAQFDPEHSPKQAAHAALLHFSMAQKSTNRTIATQALRDGQQAFILHIKQLLRNKQWYPASQLWLSFPAFHPTTQQQPHLHLDMAQGFRMLLAYPEASKILQQFQQEHSNSIFGEKVALEQAKLWAAQKDKQAISKIMQWLDRHEYSVYRPDMLLVVAQVHLQQQQYSLASHTLDLIQDYNLSPEVLATFWQTRAKTEQALNRWHMAAKAWSNYAQLETKNKEKTLLYEAHARFKAGEFPKAEQLYSITPDNLRDPLWAYRYSVCQLKNGKWKQGTARLAQLQNNPDAGIYADMATLVLTEHKAEQLLEKSL